MTSASVRNCVLAVLVLSGFAEGIIRASTDGFYYHHDGRKSPLRIEFNNSQMGMIGFYGPPSNELVRSWAPYNLPIALDSGVAELDLWELKYATEGSSMNGYTEAFTAPRLAVDGTAYNGCDMEPDGYARAYGIAKENYMATKEFNENAGSKPSAKTILGGRYLITPDHQVTLDRTIEELAPGQWLYTSRLTDDENGEEIYHFSVTVNPQEFNPTDDPTEKCIYYVTKVSRETREYLVMPMTYNDTPVYIHLWNSAADSFVCNRHRYPLVCPPVTMAPTVFVYYPGHNQYGVLPPDNVHMN
jgi:hypothetical protein